MMTMQTMQSCRVSQSIRLMVIGVIATLAILMIGCQTLTDTQLPDGVESPTTYNNREGAMRLTQAARNELAKTIASYVVSSGLLTDELEAMGRTSDFAVIPNRDKRSGQWWREGPPHSVRSLARLARGVVRKYVSGETSAWQAQLFMYEAYAEILTADGWCSGVPLSTLDFEGDWTYRAGSTTDEVYAHAIQLLDSADALAKDSLSLQATIRLLKGRAQLAMGHYADAKHTVQGIDGSFRYEMRIAFDEGKLTPAKGRYSSFVAFASVSDHEGINGLPYRSSSDPRTVAVQITSSNQTAWFPTKYITTDSSTFTLASGIEAQLILAETALYDNDAQQMMVIFNALRTSGAFTVDTVDRPSGGDRIDTLWHAGIGGVDGLRPLTRFPASTDAQRQLLFSERAAWLFATGARQGDLRRLVRKYGIDRESVYPTGQYTRPGYVDVYGTDISFGLSDLEYRNPQFTGCQADD